tara:strand:- start:685 stop:789 length:105 start_codon:yes stop_codon:yes gene_type:complete
MVGEGESNKFVPKSPSNIDEQQNSQKPLLELEIV